MVVARVATATTVVEAGVILDVSSRECRSTKASCVRCSIEGTMREPHSVVAAETAAGEEEMATVKAKAEAAAAAVVTAVGLVAAEVTAAGVATAEEVVAVTGAGAMAEAMAVEEALVQQGVTVKVAVA